MANDFVTRWTSGATLYAQIMIPGGQVRNLTGAAYETPTAAHWAQYALAASALGDSGYYGTADLPAGVSLTDAFTVIFFVQGGAAPAPADTAIATALSPGAQASAVLTDPAQKIQTSAAGVVADPAVVAGVAPAVAAAVLADPTKPIQTTAAGTVVDPAVAGAIATAVLADPTRKVPVNTGGVVVDPATAVNLNADTHTAIQSGVAQALASQSAGLTVTGTVNDSTPSATGFIISLTGGAAVPDAPTYVNLSLCFTSGALQVGKRVITGYQKLDAGRARVSFTVPFSAPPASGDAFEIL